MDQLTDFPFIIGQRAEGRSNIKGYRGAWFRCEIKDIQLRRDGIWCALQYLDFPDEKVSFTKAYQQGLTEKKKKVLMLRPSFPPVFSKADELTAHKVTGVVAIKNDVWKVGSYVDWWFDGCYWMAKITTVYNRDLMQIELPISPLGEGGAYKASVKDLRPSLNWSISQQWTVPCDEVGPNYEPFVFLLGVPLKQDGGTLQVAGCIQRTDPEGTFSTNEKREIATMNHNDPDVLPLALKGIASEGTHLGSAEFHTDWKDRHCQAAKQCNWLNCALPESSTSHISDMKAVKLVAKDDLSSFSGQMGQRDVEARNMSMELEKWIKISDAKPDLKRKLCFENGKMSEARKAYYCSVCDQWCESGAKLSAQSRNHFFSGSFGELVGNSNNKFGNNDKLGPMEDHIDMIEKLGNGNIHSLNSCLEESYIPWKQQTDTHAEANACSFEGEKLKAETDIHCAGMHELSHKDDRCNMLISKRSRSSAYAVSWGASFDIHEQSDVALFEQTINSLSQEGKCVNLEEGSVSSPAVALEELVSRVIWLKGVLQFGLKSWSHETSKKKWIPCETECNHVVLQHQNANQHQNRGSEGEVKSEETMPYGIER